MSIKGVGRTILGLVVIIIVLLAGLVGAVYYYGTRPVSVSTGTTTSTAPSVPGFVTSSTFVYESGHGIVNLDPAIQYEGYDAMLIGNVYELLLWMNGNSSTEVIPWLAESYSQLSPTQYQFKLRQNITFQDGTPFNARSVWFSFNRVLMIDGTSGTGSHGTQASWILQQLLEPNNLFSYVTPNQPYDAAWVQSVLALNFVQIVDPYTININIKAPTSQFELLLASQYGPAMIVSPSFVVSHDFPSACGTPDCPADSINYNAYFDHIAGDGLTKDNYLNLPTSGEKAGTGPYYIDSVNPTTYELVMKANPTYWGGPKNWSGPPLSVSIKTLDFRYAPDEATRILDLRAGTASAIEISPADIYSVADRNQWLTNGQLVSVIPGATVYGPFPMPLTYWYQFSTNVTDTAGHVRKFQPFADIRFRLAVGDSVNMTDANININNRLGFVAGETIPPGLSPAGAYNPAIQPIYSYNLAKVEQLLLDAQAHPLQTFVDVNGHPYPPGTIDNSFGPNNPQTIQMYVGSNAVSDIRTLGVIAANINKISIKDNLGLTFSVVPVPGGQQYSLSGNHLIYMFMGGWGADYNHVDDYLGLAMASSSTAAMGNYNYTDINTLYFKAINADASGDVKTLLQIDDEIQTLINQKVLWIYTVYYTDIVVQSSWVKGYFYNTADVCSNWSGSWFASDSYAPP